MTKYQAIYQFFSGFGLNAYPDVSVPTAGDGMPNFPYITYNAPETSDMGMVQVTANLWYRGESWVEINAKTDEIGKAIERAKIIECDDGGMIIRKGTPFAQPLADDNDDMVKRKYLIFEVTYMTT